MHAYFCGVQLGKEANNKDGGSSITESQLDRRGSKLQSDSCERYPRMSMAQIIESHETAAMSVGSMPMQVVSCSQS